MPGDIFLSILIPTFNRSETLKKNLLFIKRCITDSEYSNEIELLISENHSEDDTSEMLRKFDFGNIQNRVFYMQQNIGALANSLLVLKEAKGKYFMYLGDDDYIDANYLNKTIPALKSDNEISCVIPATKSLFLSGEIKAGRDTNKKSRVYSKGFGNCFKNSWRGTQLSAVIQLREGIYESYHKQQIDNLYPSVFYIAYNCLRGKTLHITEFPVLITQAQPVVNFYGNSNLVPDIFDNYKKLQEINSFQRILLEFKLLLAQPWRYLEYLRKGGPKALALFMITLFKDKSTSPVTKFFLPFLITTGLITRSIQKSFGYFFHG